MERATGTSCLGGWMSLGAGLDGMKKGKFLPLPGLKIRSLGRQARSQSLYRLRHSGSLSHRVHLNHEEENKGEKRKMI
jgi:hypothetical protein